MLLVYICEHIQYRCLFQDCERVLKLVLLEVVSIIAKMARNAFHSPCAFMDYSIHLVCMVPRETSGLEGKQN